MADPLMIAFDKKTGEIRALYSDALLPYIERLKAELGLSDADVKFARAAHVEPCMGPEFDGRWFVDLSPVDGPLVYCDEGGTPFMRRSDALEFEREWLLQNWLLGAQRRHTDVSIESEERSENHDR